MISKITPNIYIGEFTDVVSPEGKLNVEALKSFGITTVLNIMEFDSEKEAAAISEAWHNGRLLLHYVWSPVPVDCTTCEKYRELLSKKLRYDPKFCDNCPSNISNLPPVKKNKFLEGLEFAVYELGAILFGEPREHVLVHCTAGMDRSPFVVAKYLVDIVKTVPVLSKEKDKAFDFVDVSDMQKAYVFIKTRRPQICEHYEWLSVSEVPNSSGGLSEAKSRMQ